MTSLFFHHNFDTNSTILPNLQKTDDEIAYKLYEYLDDSQSQVGWSSHNVICSWILAIVCSALVGLSGLLPVLFIPEHAIQNEIPEETYTNSNNKINNNYLYHHPRYIENLPHRKCMKGRLKLMLSFAVGSLLGDVFLHLLPEAYHKLYSNSTLAKNPKTFIHSGHITIGFWSICGILTFVLIEMICNSNEKVGGSETIKSSLKSRDYNDVNLTSQNCRAVTPVIIKHGGSKKKEKLGISGYLNIVSNGIDNFFNGLGVGAAFLISPKAGITATICILLHEIPNGMGDFAILIKSGFTRYDTAVAQLVIASIGVLGSFLALTLNTFNLMDGEENVDNYTSWIIPFNCGGFINISLVTVLPDLMETENVLEYFKTLGCILLGIFSIVGVSGL